MEAAAAVAPELVGEHRPESIARYNAWVASPQAPFFTDLDWQVLVGLVLLYDLYYKTPAANLHAEIRTTEAKLGATVSDRDRLGWTIKPPAGDAPADVPKGSRSKPDPRTKKGAGA
jgi:hypothetical protein